MNTIYTYKDHIDKITEEQKLGGKAKNLLWLSRHGLPVPPWFCITSDSFERFILPYKIQIEHLLASNVSSNAQTINKAAEEIRELLNRTCLDAALNDQITTYLDRIGSGKLFAVRSSCNKEDSKEYSFAGLFSSFLYIPASRVVHYVRLCWLSLFNTGALVYFSRNKINPLDMRMAVIVQEMIASEKSGVLFQANPIGTLEESIIIGGYGAGEGIVSDQVETDTYYYNRLNNTTKVIKKRKREMCMFDAENGEGTKKSIVPEEWQERDVLSHEDLTSLMALSKTIEKIYDHYQDIEWAISGGNQYHIIQSRPITTIPEGALNLYDNSNIIESYPGISLPLTVAVASRGYVQAFRAAFLSLKFRSSIINRNRHIFSNLVAEIQGRMYYNVMNWYNMIQIFPFGTASFSSDMELMLGLEKMENKKKNQKNNNSFIDTARIFAMLIWFFLAFRYKFIRYKRDFKEIYLKAKKQIEAYADNNHRLKLCYNSYFDNTIEIINFDRINDLFLMTILGKTKKQLIQTGLDETEAEYHINGLLVGEKGMESVKPIKCLEKMISQLKESTPLLDQFKISARDGNYDSLKAEFPGFYREFFAYIEEFGDRGITELKMETNSFRQNPCDLAKVILNHAAAPLIFKEINKRESQVRNQAMEKIEEFYKGHPLKKIQFNYCLKKLRFFIRCREEMRFNRSRFFGVIREIFRKIANNWETQGILSIRDDIFFLNEKEVFEFIDNPQSENMKQIINERKAINAENETKHPISRMWLKGRIKKNHIPQTEEKTDPADNSTGLRGLGCCPGKISGEALVVLSPDVTMDTNGKILVAHNTDPGWVFLIIGAKGLIVEKGSLLSHTAIIGRELGLPTIVNATGALQKIKSGMNISMDGGTGYIEILQ